MKGLIARVFPESEGHAMVGDEKERLVQGMTHVAPNVTRLSPGPEPSIQRCPRVYSVKGL